MKKLFRIIYKTINSIFPPHRTIPPNPAPIKDIINSNFKKIKDELDKFKITTSILIEGSQRQEREIKLILKALGEIQDELESIQFRNRRPD